MAVLAREENERLRARIEALEAGRNAGPPPGVGDR
jgi:BMFP domain-containing protein YqiC